MALTPEGTPYVESTDLVANYPAASLSLANRVDLVGVLPFADAAARTTAIPTPTDGQFTYLQDTNTPEFYDGSNFVSLTAAGLVHINTSTFSAQSSVSINDIFTATFDNYLILIRSTHSTGSNLAYRMRLSGTDNTTTNYSAQFNSASLTTISGNRLTAQTSGLFGNAQVEGFTSAYFINPAIAEPTLVLSQNVAGSTVTLTSYSSIHNVSTAYDGVTFLPSSGTFSGTIRTYGYKNS